MASKRGASVQLTDRNWNLEDDEAEEAGHFKHAGHEEISKRVIKKAKRRGSGSETSSGFSGFVGFGSPFPSSVAASQTSSTTFTGFKGLGNLSAIPEASNANTSTETNEAAAVDSQYFKRLKTLNENVCEWIKKHVSQDPFVDLSPVFKDYGKHMANIEKKFPLKRTTKDTQTGTKAASEVSSIVQPTFLGLPTVVSPFVTSPTSINGGASSSPVKINESKPDHSAATSQEDTPKTDSNVRSSPEEDAFYSTRCKLFFKRETSWAELGVGMLSLKKTNNKTQVLVRNDTALGKILLNVFLSDATPTSRSGKNNVLLMSIPNPPVFTKDADNAKPVSYLIRVKTSENADDLHKQMGTSRESL